MNESDMLEQLKSECMNMCSSVEFKVPDDKDPGANWEKHGHMFDDVYAKVVRDNLASKHPIVTIDPERHIIRSMDDDIFDVNYLAILPLGTDLIPEKADTIWEVQNQSGTKIGTVQYCGRPEKVYDGTMLHLGVVVNYTSIETVQYVEIDLEVNGSNDQ